MTAANLLLVASVMTAVSQPRPISSTDVAIGMMAVETQGASEREDPLLAVSVAYRTPITWTTGMTTYALALPTLAVGGSPLSFARFAIPVGVLVVSTEPRSGRGAGVEAGIGGGIVLSGGAAEGVNLRPFLAAEIGAAVFTNGGIRLRYLGVPRSSERGTTIPAYHGLYLVFGATAW
jgi:hypothetical protein